MPATSDPAAGSLTPRQARYSPLIAGTRNSWHSSSEPNLAKAGVAMSVCTPIDIGTPPALQWPRASAIATEKL